ncbi:glycine cleavage system H protein-like [Halichondria panicea]|uniref:glycine cleavage system H protein-like n=1 Tax=Halichondria panicea TaxID=6063 RepID=UPI00312B35B7
MAAAVVGRWLSKGLPRVSLLRPSASAQVCLAGRWYSDELEFREPDSGQYRYTTTHEWASLKGNTATVGISIYAQEKLGDVVFAELPDLGQQLERNETMGVLESVKAAADIHSPLSGTVVEINSELEDAPELINEDPYNKGWLLKLKVSGEEEFHELIDNKEYKKFLEESV